MENTPAKRTPRFRKPTSTSLPARPTHRNVDTTPPSTQPRSPGTGIGLPTLVARTPVETVDKGYVSKLAVPQEGSSRVHTPQPVQRVDNITTPKLPTAQAESKPNAKAVAVDTKPTKSKKQSRVKITARDQEIIKACHSHGWLTLPHISRIVGSMTETQRPRINALVREGYLGVDESQLMNRYNARRKGLDAIGLTDAKIQSEAAPSTYSHNNKQATALIGLSIGDAKFNELQQREVDMFNVAIESRNARWTLENELLERNKNLLRQQGSLTTTEKAILSRKPKGMTPLAPNPKVVSFMPFAPEPKLVITEREIRLSEQEKGVNSAIMDWGNDMEKFLHLEEFPRRWESNPYEPATTQEENATMERILSTFADGLAPYMFKHWNSRNVAHDGSFTTLDNFGHRHSYDGIAVFSHRVSDDQKTITGGSWGIELEDNKKNPMEYKRVILQTINHPLLAGVIYFTDKTQVKTRIEQGANLAIAELVANNRKNIGIAEKKIEAAKLVRETVDVRRTPLINYRANEAGYCG